MKSIYYILFCCLVLSCISKTDNEKTVCKNKRDRVEKDNTFKLSDNTDLVVIECFFFGDFYDRNFVVRLTNDRLRLLIDDKEFEIKSGDKQQYLIKYINRFYIEKKENIVLLEKEEPAPVADYPSILVRVFKNNKEILINEETLYSNMEFAPSFIAFYDLLNELILTPLPHDQYH